MLLFPDNTVLVNFALIGRLDLLDELVRGRSAWTHAVSEECWESARQPGLHSMSRLADTFGEPLTLQTSREITDARSFRARMAGPGDPPKKHLGEAEALAIISNRASGDVFVTDDQAARDLARTLEVVTYSTCQLLRLAVRSRRLTAQNAWQHVTALRRHPRRLLDSPTEAHTYFAWCSAA